jgi:hypothetical protein
MVSDLQALGQLYLVDSSFWAIGGVSWLASKGLRGVRLHLCFSLNKMTTQAMFLSYDKSPTKHEREMLIEFAQQAMTFVVDRGYVGLQICLDLIELGAFFVIRERNNLCYRVIAENEVCLESKFSFANQVQDLVIKLERDAAGVVFRLVSFNLGTHHFKLLTNRFDLSTSQIIMLYAWRWQIELIFRAWKHTLKGLHLINLSREGIQIQFYILAIASFLFALLQQELAPGKETNEKAKSITASLSKVFCVSWRLLRKSLRLLRNCLARPVSFYVKELVEQRL